MNEAQRLTIELLRYEITGIPVSDEYKTGITDDILESVYDISVSQSVSSIVGSALSKLDLLNDAAKQAFFNEQLANLYKTEQIKYDLSCIYSLFESEQIEFLPLKGAVLRDYYPKPEMRESCDIDVLIRKENLDRACALLEEKLGYKRHISTPHDVGMFSPAGIELELHFALYDYDDDKKEILDTVWDYATPCNGYVYKHEMQKEFFVLYHIIHMAKHVISGGCGVRPFLDLWIIENSFECDKNTLWDMLRRAGVDTFAQVAFKTSRVWFGGENSDETIALLEDYIFSAGIYGNLENQVAASLAKNENKFKNIMERIFLPYDKLKVIYPALRERPILTPWYEIKRWKRIIFKDKAKHQIVIMKHNAQMSDEKKKNVTALMENLGLK